MSTSKTPFVFVSLLCVLLLASSVEAGFRPTTYQVQYGTPSTCYNPGFTWKNITSKDVLTINSMGDDILVKEDSTFKGDAWALLFAKEEELVNATTAQQKLYEALNALPDDMDKCEEYHCADPVKRECVTCGSYQTISGKKYQCQVWNGVANWMDTSTTLSTCGCNCYSPSINGAPARRFLNEESESSADLMENTFSSLKRKLLNNGIDLNKIKGEYKDPIADILKKDSPASRQSAVFINQQVDTRNGFSVEFTLKVDNPWCELTAQRFASAIDMNIPFGKCYTTSSNGVSVNTCFTTSTTVYTKFQDEMDFNNCGGEGLAFVVKPELDPLQVSEGMGSGLGYAGLSNVLAIEFDFKTNIEGRDDPTSAKMSRHISLIAKRGAATASETLKKDEGALAWNDEPINMGDNPTQRGVVNNVTTWRIEYKDQKFNVFWGNSKQLEWTSTKFSFKNYFGTKSSFFYLGFTSSSIGKRGHTIKIGDIKLGTQDFAIDKTSSYIAPYQVGTTLKTSKVCLSPPCSSIPDNLLDITSGKQFNVAYSVKDNCYEPIDLIDGLNETSLKVDVKGTDCTHVQTNLNQNGVYDVNAQYILTFICPTPGVKNISVQATWRNKTVKLTPIVEKVLPPSADTIEIEFDMYYGFEEVEMTMPGGSKVKDSEVGFGSITSPAYFYTKPYYTDKDGLLNYIGDYPEDIVLPSQMSASNIQITWPDGTVYSNYIVIQRKLGVEPWKSDFKRNEYIFYAINTPVGFYKVSSKYFKKDYWFFIEAGEADRSFTQVYVTDSLPNPIDTDMFPLRPKKTTIQTGNSLTLLFDLIDESQNSSNGANKRRRLKKEDEEEKKKNQKSFVLEVDPETKKHKDKDPKDSGYNTCNDFKKGFEKEDYKCKTEGNYITCSKGDKVKAYECKERTTSVALTGTNTVSVDVVITGQEWSRYMGIVNGMETFANGQKFTSTLSFSQNGFKLFTFIPQSAGYLFMTPKLNNEEIESCEYCRQLYINPGQIKWGSIEPWVRYGESSKWFRYPLEVLGTVKIYRDQPSMVIWPRLRDQYNNYIDKWADLGYHYDERYPNGNFIYCSEDETCKMEAILHENHAGMLPMRLCWNDLDPKSSEKFVTPCKDNIPEFKRLVFRNTYTFTIIQYTSRVNSKNELEWVVSNRQDMRAEIARRTNDEEYDVDAGNGPWRAEHTHVYTYITYWNNGKETRVRYDNWHHNYLEWGAWDSQLFIVQFRTYHWMRYNRFATTGNVRIECTLPFVQETCDVNAVWSESIRSVGGEIAFSYQNQKSVDHAGEYMLLKFYAKKDPLQDLYTDYSKWSIEYPGRVSQVVEDPWKLVWTTWVRIIPDYPSMAYIDMKDEYSYDCPDGNCLKSIEVGTRSQFDILLFDRFGNPTNLARNNNFMNLWGDYTWWGDKTAEFRPIPSEWNYKFSHHVDNSYNRYALNMYVTRSGFYRWRSPWFDLCVSKNFREECKKEFVQVVQAGPVVHYHSWMILQNGQEFYNSGSKAGQNLTFNCYFRDQYQNYCPITRYNSTGDQTVFYRHWAPVSSSPAVRHLQSSSLEVSKTLNQLPSSGKTIPYWTQMVVNHTRAFENTVYMYVNGQQTTCYYCKNLIHPNTPVLFDVYRQIGGGNYWIQNEKTQTTFQNLHEFPMFYIEAKDIYHNVHSQWPGGFESVEGNIVNTVTKDKVAEMVPPERQGRGIVFRLKDTYYDTRHQDYSVWRNTPKGNYFFQIKLNYKGSEPYQKELLYPVFIAGDGTDTYSMETVCDQSFASRNDNFSINAGLWSENFVEFTLLSPRSTDATKYAITKIMYRRPEDMVKLIREDTGREDPNMNYTVTNPKWGVLQFRFNHTVKGVYKYKVKAMWDFNQNDPTAGFVTFNNTFQLVVRAGPIDIVRFWSTDIAKYSGGLFYTKTVDYQQTLNISLYDAWNNTVEPDQIPADLKGELGLQFVGISTWNRDSSRTNALASIGEAVWRTDVNETHLQVTVHATMPGWYSIKMYKGSGSARTIRPFFFFENNKPTLVEDLDIYYYPGYPDQKSTIQNIVVAPFKDNVPIAALASTQITTIQASDMVKFIMYLKDQYGNTVPTLISEGVGSMVDRMNSLGLKVFDPRNDTEINQNFQVWQLFQKDGLTEKKQPLTKDATTGEMSPIPLSKIDTVCGSPVCFTWTWEIFNTSVVGIYSNVVSEKVYKMVVKPGPMNVESLDLLLRCKELSQKTKVFSTMKASGKSEKEASETANAEANSEPVWLSAMKDKESYNCSTQTSPEFKIVFYDYYDNMIEGQPENVINSQLWFGIYNDTKNDVDAVLVWCKDFTQKEARRRRLLRRVLTNEEDLYASRFKMCMDGTSQSYEYKRDFGTNYLPAMRWYTLAGDQTYMVALKLTRTTTDLKKFFEFGIIPAFTDPLASDLPMDADKSIVLPLNFTTKPLQPFPMSFDLRTSTNKRSSRWVYPIENITIASTFEFDEDWDPIYSVNYGDFPGMHELEVWSNEVYPSTAPNFMTIKANGYQLGGGKVVSWINEPTCKDEDGKFNPELTGIVFFDPIERVALGNLENLNGTVLPANNTDYEYVVTFEVYDENGYKCTPTTESISLMTSISLTNPKGVTLNIPKVNINNQKRASFQFQPEVAGTYTVKINDYSATFEIKNGSPSALSTVQIVYENLLSSREVVDESTNETTVVEEWDTNFEAETEIHARIYVKDRFGNTIEPTEELAQTFTYYFREKSKTSTENNWLLLYHESNARRFRRNRRALQISNTQIKAADDESFDILFHICPKGAYEFQTLLRTTAVTCIDCDFNIVPTEMVTEKSQVWYMDSTTGEYNLWMRNVTLAFPNTEMKPFLRLYPVDKCENVLAEFPSITAPVVKILDNQEGLKVFTNVDVGANTPRDYIELVTTKQSETNAKGETEIFYQFTLQGEDYLDEGKFDDLLSWQQGANGSVSVELKIQEETYSFNAYLENQNTDGDNDVLSPAYSVIILNTDKITEKTVGEISTNQLELRTINDRRKMDVVVSHITYTVVNKKSTDTSLSVNITNSEVLGKFLVSVSTTTEYYFDGPLEITFSYEEDGTVTKLTNAKLNITFAPDVLATYTLLNETPLKAGIVGEEYSLSFAPRDQYGNLVIVDETNTGINLYSPITFEEAAEKMIPVVEFTTSLDEDTNDLIITIVPTRVTNYGSFQGEYTVASKYFPATETQSIIEYTIEVVVGPPKAENCEFTIASSSLVAGEAFRGYLTARDSLGNTIAPEGIDYSQFKVVYVDTSYIVHEVEGTELEVTPIEDGYPNSVKLTILDTKVGTGKFSAFMGDVELKCNECSVSVAHNTPWVPNTKILVSVGSLSVPVTVLQAPEGELFEFNVQFFDYYNNSVTSLNETETAGATLRKNYIQWNGGESFDLYANPYKNGKMKMSVIPDDEATETGGRLLQTIEEDDVARENFVRSLVPATGYEMVVTYYVGGINKGEVVLAMTITGDNLINKGNGLVNQETTEVNATSLTIMAGDTAKFTLVLKTDNNKLYSNVYADFDWEEDIEVVVPEEITYQITLLSQSTFEVALTSQAANYDRPTSVGFSINGVTLVKKVLLFVVPNEPDTSSTEFVQVFPESVEMDESIYVKLLIKDKYGNNITDIDALTNRLSTHLDASLGKIMDGPIGYGNAIFGFQYSPEYPPERFGVFIDWTDEDGNKFPLNAEAIETKVYTKLDPDRFEVIGDTDLFGLTAIDGTALYIYAKEQSRNCYAGEVLNISARVFGPFVSNDPKDLSIYGDEVIDIRIDDVRQVEVTDSACTYHYEATIPAESLYKAGYYTVEIYMNNQTQYEEVTAKTYQLINPFMDVETQPLKSFRIINVKAGPIVASNSIVTLNQKNRGNGPYTMQAEQSVIFDVQTYDKFWNKYDYAEWEEELEVSDLRTTENKTAETYKISVLKKTQGEYTVTVSITTPTGDYYDMSIKIGGEEVRYADLKKVDGPSSIIVLAGACTATVPGIDTSDIDDGIVYIGERTLVTIQCKDRFGNNLNRGGEKFDNFIIGTDLEKVDNDKFPGTIMDNNDGSYHLVFVTPYSGNYKLYILFNQVLYGDPVSFVASVRCSDATKPTQCPVTDICEESYFGCENLDSILNTTICADPEKPILCQVSGKDSCVGSGIECDCEEGYTRCDYTSACVEDSLISSICPRYFDYACNEGEVKCDDGSCRTNLENCGSPYVCPPGTKQCEDLSCVLEDLECPAFESCTSSGTETYFYKCWDQTCAAKPEECPTKITCLPGQVVCPDSSCKNSPLECSLPTDCVLDTMFKCGDQSCRNSIDDCPQKTTCSKGKALCDDGTCQKDCLTQKAESTALRRLSRKLQGSTYTYGVADSTKVICPGGEVESSPYLCPSVDTCPGGLIKCPDGSCKEDLTYCPIITCVNGEYMCADGTCSYDKDLCATRIQCPTLTPVKCADGTCADSIGSCPDILSCPPETPYKCGTSGECRRNAKECPVASICPDGLPIKCTDGSCVKSPLHCEDTSLMKSAPEGYIVCPDGSFSTSLIMCPSTVSCAHGLFKCVDGQCVDNIEICKSTSGFAYDVIAVSAELPYRCPDGSYRAAFADCPTQRVCPKDTPILCDDGNCRQSKTQCASSTECGFGLTRCPDGTCTSNVCSTLITCAVSEPYKCYDNSCRKDPRDCPQKTCPQDEPILCADGTCSSHRLYCISIWEPCSPDKPVRCPDSQCYPDSSYCKAYDECPPPFQKCYGGECAVSQDECQEVTCPVQTPHKCTFTGSCVTSPEFCENEENGCPYNAPTKCRDGRCVAEYSECPSEEEIGLACNSTTKQLCPNGACMEKDEVCVNIFGCLDNEKKCGDGQCISPEKDCPVAICPSGSVKCNDGMCMESFANCRDSSMLDSAYCIEKDNGLNVPCANGMCVSSAEQCPPLFECPSNMKRCGDGSCNLAALCPLADTCPGKQMRCDNGACADDYSHCPNELGCPNNIPYKCVTGNKLGLCVSNVKECEDIPIEPSSISTGYCQDPEPYRCLDGSCASSPEICIEIGYGCEDNDIVCPDGTCQTDYSMCTTTDKGCPLDQPFKCADDTCKEFPIDINGDGTGCLPEVVCPDYVPYKCQSGQCVGDPVMCGTVDKEVIVDQSCPQASPIMCDLGYCVSTVTDCIGLVNDCPTEKPYSCVLGVCAVSPDECINLGSIIGRRLQETDEPTEYNLDGCTKDKPARCYDGSCMPSYDICPIYPGCTNPDLPYKCPNGQCTSSIFSCPEVEECKAGTERCVDGVCRESCQNVPYNGCPNSTPLKCGDNSCARTLSECAGSSDCRTQNNPFRCSTGECVADVSMCKRSALSYMSEKFTLSLKPDETVTQSFIFDPETLVKNARITVPSGALLSPLDSLAGVKTTGDTQLRISPVPFSKIADIKNPLGTEEESMARLIFPLTDGELSPASSIRSSVIKLESLNRTDPYEYYRFPVVLKLRVDTMASVQFIPEDHLCLGTIVGEGNSSKWTCASRNIQSPYNPITRTMEYTVPKDGVYAVIFNPSPLPQDTSSWCERSLLCSNMWYIISIAIFFLVIVAPLTYIFWRMYRYVLKYRESKKMITNIHNKYDEVMNTSTDTPFQSVKDKLEGIIFRKNPLLKPEEEENEEIKLLRKAVEKVDSDRKMLDMERKELMDRHTFYSREISRLRAELDAANRRKATVDTNFTENISKAHDFI